MSVALPSSRYGCDLVVEDDIVLVVVEELSVLGGFRLVVLVVPRISECW